MMTIERMNVEKPAEKSAQSCYENSKDFIADTPLVGSGVGLLQALRHFFANHNSCQISVCTWNFREDRRVGHIQAVDTDDPTSRIDDAKRIVRRPHSTGTAGMPCAHHPAADIGLQFPVVGQQRLQMWPVTYQIVVSVFKWFETDGLIS